MNEGAQKLAGATRQIYTTAMATDKIKKMAVVIGDEVKTVISLASPIEDGEIRFRTPPRWPWILRSCFLDDKF
jgi:hypothetical protein